MIGALLALLLAQSGANVREAPPQPKAVKPPELTRAPALVDFYPATYPADRLALGQTADVACQVDLDAQGAVTNVIIEKGAAPDFDQAALAAIRRFRFSPAEVDGRPAPVRIRYVYHFIIEEKKATPKQQTLDRGLIRGQVVEAGSKKPIAGADVLDKQQGIAVSTNGDGRYQIDSVAPGARVLSVSAPGFETREVTLQLAPRGEAQAPRAYLHRVLTGDLSATVAGEKAEDAPTRRTLSHEELVNVPGAFNDPVRVVQNLPGLARAPFLSGALLVRGTPPQDTGTYLDGLRIPILFHFLGGPSVINEQLIDRIDFYPGGYGAYYGRNLTSALDVGTRKGDANALHGSASLDLIEAVGAVEGPLSRDTQLEVAARRSHVDLFLPLFIPNDPNRGATVVTPIYWDYQARADHRLEDGDSLSLLVFGSDDKLTVIQKGGKRTLPLSLGAHTGFHRALLGFRHAVSDALDLTVQPAVGWQVQSFSVEGIGQGAFSQPQSADITDVTGSVRAQVAWRPSSFLELRAGTDSQLDRASYGADLQSSLDLRSLGTPITQETKISRVQPFIQLGEFLEAELKDGKFRATLGLRSDQIHWRGRERVALDPRLWLRYQLTDKTALKAYSGLYHQPPTPLQIDNDLGNPDLGLEGAAQFGTGVEHRFSDAWNVSAEVFYNRRYDLVQRVDPFTQAGVILNPRYQNAGIGRSYGLELLIRREITAKLYGWISYTLSRSEVLRVPGEAWRAFQYDQPHILTVVVGYRPNPGWELSSRFRLVSGNPIAPVNSATFDADAGRFVADYGRVGDGRSPAFAQLDARAQKTWTWDTWDLSLYLDVQNVTNHKNEEIHVYDYRFREQGSISGIPILPTLGLKARF